MPNSRPLLCLRTLLVALGALLCSPALLAVQAIDRIFGQGLENADMPANADEAARFLTQASFGPDPASIARVRQIGYNAWITEQMAIAPTLQRPQLEPLTDAQASNSPTTYTQSRRIDLWFKTATYAPDQLRQRVAWALSQVLVISDRQDNLGGDPDGVAEYWDILARNSFGNYRALLEQVTLSPQMAKYLTSLRNRAPYTTGNPPITVLPDENYAREVMQLFSMGLIKRNVDFSPALVGGLTVPTYDQAVISQLSKVFTGFNYANRSNYSGNPTTNNPDIYAQMQCMETALFGTSTVQVHDSSSKTIFDSIVINVGNQGQYCDNDLTQALNAIAGHANVGPFLSRQLIQRLVTSTPSAAYIGRVAAKFNNNGSGVRGDLAAVVRAILLDPEARGTATGASAYGKVREPLLKLVALWRAFNAQMPASLMEAGTPTSVAYTPMGITSPEGNYQQRPLGAPTVFNFYEPDYQPPGPMDAANAYAPELQIINEVTLVNAANSLNTYSTRFIGMTTPPSPAVHPLLNYDPLLPLSANPAALVDALNGRLLYGRMPLTTRSALIAFLGNSSIASMTPLAKISEVVRIIVVSPDFAVQQ